MNPPQHMEALARANEVRFARAEVHRAVAEGRMTIAHALDEECCQSMPLFDLLCCQRRWGPIRSMSVLRSLQIGSYRLVGELADRQREAVMGACAPKGKSR